MKKKLPITLAALTLAVVVLCGAVGIFCVSSYERVNTVMTYLDQNEVKGYESVS